MGIVCIDERVWRELVARLKGLAARSGRVQKVFSPPAADGWLDAQDVCRRLGISKRTLQMYRTAGQLPFSNVGGKYFYREQDVAGYLKRKEAR